MERTYVGLAEAFDAIALIVVEALPERTEEEARAEFDAFMASDCGRQRMRETTPERGQDERRCRQIDLYVGR